MTHGGAKWYVFSLILTALARTLINLISLIRVEGARLVDSFGLIVFSGNEIDLVTLGI
jgi:hypothetical protein